MAEKVKAKRLWRLSLELMLPLCNTGADNSAQSKDELERLPQEALKQSCKPTRRNLKGCGGITIS
jgi:hypothetical protein